MSSKNKLFSVRMGYRKEEPPQIESLDARTRVAFRVLFEETMSKQNSGQYDIWCEFFGRFSGLTQDEAFVPDKSELSSAAKKYTEIFFSANPWHDIFMIVEWMEKRAFVYLDEDGSSFVGNYNYNVHLDNEGFHTKVNSILDIHNVGYSFIKGKFLPLNNELESVAVQEAVESRLEKVQKHIRNSISLLDRNEPNYENSIKESISAIEGILLEISDKKNFNNARSKLRSFLHPKFIDVIDNLYHFTCDEGGIRHAIKDEKQQEIDRELAVCMIVTCSAIANYLAAKMPQLKKEEAGKAADDDNIPF